jgi:uncharacterized RDD family membrane protein YckC
VKSESTQTAATKSSGQEDPLGRRLGAALIDLALLAVLFIAFALVFGETETEEGTVSLSLNGVGALVYFALALLYYFAFEASIGRTVGKLFLSLRVVAADGGRPSGVAIALRTLLRIVDWLPLFYLAGFIAMLATGTRRQRLGDLAAKTGVVRAGAAERRSLALIPVALLLLMLAASAVYHSTHSSGEAGDNTTLGVSTTITLELTPANRTTPVLFRDDFSDTTRGWYVARNRDLSAAYVNDRYRVKLPHAFTFVSTNRLDRPSDAIRITALLRQAAGGRSDELGVACLSTRTPDQGYSFVIGPSDGFVGVRRLVRFDDKESFVEVYATEDVINPGNEAHRIRADCIGARSQTPARLTLHANGHRVAETTVPRGYRRFAAISLYTYSDKGRTTAFFDDIVVRELKR